MELTLNGQPHQAAEKITVAQLLEDLGLTGKFVAVEVNLDLIPRQQHATHSLAAGDRVEIVSLVGGG